MSKSILTLVALSAFVLSCSTGTKESKSEEAATDTVTTEAVTSAINSLTPQEEADGWQLLFDGKTPNGWVSYGGFQKGEEYFPQAWKVIDSSIHIQGSGRGEIGSEQGGDIIFNAKKFADFHLKMEWKVDSASNSGIFYRGQVVSEYDYIWKTSPEMQVLDNVNHPDAGKGTNGNRQSSSLYDLIPAQPQNAKPWGNWNQVEILAVGNDIKHIQNGDTVVSYTIGSARLDSLIAISKWPKENPNWGMLASEGYIGLQDHGDNVWFRNIKIKEL